MFLVYYELNCCFKISYVSFILGAGLQKTIWRQTFMRSLEQTLRQQDLSMTCAPLVRMCYDRLVRISVASRTGRCGNHINYEGSNK